MPAILPLLSALGIGAWFGSTTNAAASAPTIKQDNGMDITKLAIYGIGAFFAFKIAKKYI